MATKPTAVPNWASTTTNIVTPNAAKRDLGWAFGENPASSFENWRARTVGEWFGWLDERLGDNPNGLRVLNPLDASQGFNINVASTVTMQADRDIDWIVNGVREMSLDGVGDNLKVGNGSDSIAIFGKGTNKSLVYAGSASKQFRWSDASSEFSFFCNSVVAQFRVNPLRASLTVPLSAVQYNFGLFSSMSAGAGNTIEFDANGTVPLSVGPNRVVQVDPSSLGDLANPWETVTAVKYSVPTTNIPQPIVNKYDRVANNSVTAVAHVDGGTLVGSPYNITSVIGLGTGFYDVTFTEPVSVKPIFSGNPANSFTSLSFNTITSTKVRVEICSTASVVRVESDFSMMMVG